MHLYLTSISIPLLMPQVNGFLPKNDTSYVTFILPFIDVFVKKLDCGKKSNYNV